MKVHTHYCQPRLQDSCLQPACAPLFGTNAPCMLRYQAWRGTATGTCLEHASETSNQSPAKHPALVLARPSKSEPRRRRLWPCCLRLRMFCINTRPSVPWPLASACRSTGRDGVVSILGSRARLGAHLRPLQTSSELVAEIYVDAEPMQACRLARLCMNRRHYQSVIFSSATTST